MGSLSNSDMLHFLRVAFTFSFTTGLEPLNPLQNATSHSFFSSNRALIFLSPPLGLVVFIVFPCAAAIIAAAASALANVLTAKPRCNLSRSRRVFGRHGPNVATTTSSSAESLPMFACRMHSSNNCPSSAATASSATSTGKLPKMTLVASGKPSMDGAALVDGVSPPWVAFASDAVPLARGTIASKSARAKRSALNAATRC